MLTPPSGPAAHDREAGAVGYWIGSWKTKAIEMRNAAGRDRPELVPQVDSLMEVFEALQNRVAGAGGVTPGLIRDLTAAVSSLSALEASVYARKDKD